MTKPMLSIGIIFKNEIRCLERCVKSLDALRGAFPCELVMADTGSDDGSREVAAQYADILFDFPWINDFAAARNAVMDRCSGEWYFSIDADEWLGGDISELTYFLKMSANFQGNAASLMIRDYLTPDLDESYSDFLAVRLFRLSTGLRYEGAIHECWPYEKSGSLAVHHLAQVILHHDGYVNLHGEAGKAKLERNLLPLREQLRQAPDDLRTLTLYLGSAKEEPDYMAQMRCALELIREKHSGWDTFGPSIFRYAVMAAKSWGLPDLKDWIREAKELFPDSPFTAIDVAYIEFVQMWDESNYPQCIATGERCLRAMADLRDSRGSQSALMFGSVMMQNAHWEQELITFLAEAHLREKEPKKCREYLERVDHKFLNGIQTKRMTRILIDLHVQSREDTMPLVKAAWSGIQEPVPSKARAEERKHVFLQEASAAFQESKTDEGRPAYTLFAPLGTECEAGAAARMMELENASALEQALSQVENWSELPIAALVHALERGVEFPIAGKPLNIEEMDGLASRLAHDRDSFYPLAGRVLSECRFQQGQKLAWARAIALTMVQVYDWGADEPNAAEGMSLARAFAQVEERFLACCYAPDALCEDGLYVLPPMHRFGWWCAKAFGALDAGDAVDYTRSLRKGLSTCGAMKPMVEFLMRHTPELRTPPPSAELLALAQQIKTVLAGFAPDDPTVAALKQSEAYRKVAHIIEGFEAPVIGGQPQ